MCLFSRTPFLLIMSISLASLLSTSMWKFISTQLMGQGFVPDHWTLVVQRLEVSALTAWSDFSLGLETKTLLQAAVG